MNLQQRRASDTDAALLQDALRELELELALAIEERDRYARYLRMGLCTLSGIIVIVAVAVVVI